MEEEIQVRLAELAGGNFRPKYSEETLLLTYCVEAHPRKSLGDYGRPDQGDAQGETRNG